MVISIGKEKESVETGKQVNVKPTWKCDHRNISIAVFEQRGKAPFIVVQKFWRSKETEEYQRQELRMYPAEMQSLIDVCDQYAKSSVFVRQ